MSSGYVINNLRLWFLCIVVMNFNWKNELFKWKNDLWLVILVRKEKKNTKELASGIPRMGLQWFLFESEN